MARKDEVNDFVVYSPIEKLIPLANKIYNQEYKKETIDEEIFLSITGKGIDLIMGGEEVSTIHKKGNGENIKIYIKFDKGEE